VQQWNNNGTLFLLPYASSGTSVVTQNWVNTGQPYATGPGGTPGLLALDINGDGNSVLGLRLQHSCRSRYTVG
jgi:hypothetical protein